MDEKHNIFSKVFFFKCHVNCCKLYLTDNLQAFSLIFKFLDKKYFLKHVFLGLGKFLYLSTIPAIYKKKCRKKV